MIGLSKASSTASGPVYHSGRLTPARFNSPRAHLCANARRLLPSASSSRLTAQAEGIEPDIKIEEDLPDELKKKLASVSEKLEGEASLRGHLKNPNAKAGASDKEKNSGSSAYVPIEADKDTQLQYALSFLRGKATQAKPPTRAIDATR